MSTTRIISEADIVLFAGVSGDNNAVHTNEEFAATTAFGGRIAHGFLTASVISAAVANRLPGPGTVYLGFPDESFPADHPQQWLGDYAVGAVAYDLFPPDSPIRRLYEWAELTRFVESHSPVVRSK